MNSENDIDLPVVLFHQINEVTKMIPCFHEKRIRTIYKVNINLNAEVAILSMDTLIKHVITKAIETKIDSVDLNDVIIVIIDHENIHTGSVVYNAMKANFNISDIISLFKLIVKNNANFIIDGEMTVDIRIIQCPKCSA